MAVVDEELAGYVLFSPVTIQTSVGVVAALSLAPMAVAPKYQRRGIGGQLVQAGLEACRAHGHTIAVVLGYPEFQGRFGYRSELAHALDSVFGGGEAWMAIELVPGSLAGVQGKLAYSPPLARLRGVGRLPGVVLPGVVSAGCRFCRMSLSRLEGEKTKRPRALAPRPLHSVSCDALKAYIVSQRRARDSNPQPVSRQLISNQPADHSLTLPEAYIFTCAPGLEQGGSICLSVTR